MSIWFNPGVTAQELQPLGVHSLGGHLGMEMTEVGENYLKGRMPVDERTRQPFGLLHGGASAALAETLGSVGSALIVDPGQYHCVGLEINANHIRGVKDGFVYGTAVPVHIGKTTHVWDIRIVDGEDRLVCISRLTVAILKK